MYTVFEFTSKGVFPRGAIGSFSKDIGTGYKDLILKIQEASMKHNWEGLDNIDPLLFRVEDLGGNKYNLWYIFEASPAPYCYIEGV